MPAHEHNSFGDVVRRLRRHAGHRADLRRSGPWAEGLATEPGTGPGSEGWTTVDATIRPLGSDRYRRLGWAPGEPHLLRDDLGVAPAADRAEVRRSLLYVAQHTDVHVCDAQSPARVEGGEAFGWVNPGSDSGHRPQETCTTQVLDQLVRATNAVATSPVSGAPMAWCIQTGDNTDNRTTSEVRWWLDVLGGRPVTPNTGAAGRYEGLQRSGWRMVWHPDRPGWDRRQQQGYPHLPGFLDASVARFVPEGLRVPWLAVFGNHDQIFTGTFGPPVGRNLRIDLLEPMLAGSSRKPANAVGLVRAIAHATTVGADTERWEQASRGPGVHTVTADPDARRSVTLDEYLAALLADGADGEGPGPAGHGFGPEHLVEHRSWWSRSEGEHVQVLGLDTCNHTNGDGGGIGPRQAAWLEAELARHHARHLDVHGRWVEGGGTDRLVVLASHHNSWTMANAVDDEFDPGPRTTGAEVVALLERFPNVVLWVNGHSHQHKVVGHRRAAGGGWWEVNTSSAIDFGQQGRTIELFDNGDGTASFLVTVLDHAAEPLVPYRAEAGWTPGRLASLSRELAANDDRWFDPVSLLGRPEDRNVELPVAVPFALR
ncbi:TIGR03767 family metallophosphoesterase [Aquihabitans sp. G128]|uniref:TIGR03767 family metallophosphoesterase n=1 Tax=Aquihabitans sp. G128 TaxID=2849779 RepID=UPI001C24B0C7|nr:TIGR03767 family metallophosphoesterase [Aquihabitans sp. G128]QXC63119.1 TIGR03767 family metallophosphoesterase [Aquihabitans sp. G128]